MGFNLFWDITFETVAATLAFYYLLFVKSLYFVFKMSSIEFSRDLSMFLVETFPDKLFYFTSNLIILLFVLSIEGIILVFLIVIFLVGFKKVSVFVTLTEISAVSTILTAGF